MKHHIATYTKAILLMALMLLLPSMMRAEKEAWVGYDLPTNTLTFYYNENKGTNSATYQCYSLNEDGVAPAWGIWAPYATKVVFDESFKWFHPTTCYRWFDQFTKLTTIEGTKNLNTTDVTNMAYMFSFCSSLVTLDLSSSTFSTTKVTSTKGMFRNCSALKELNTSKQFSVSSSCDASDMFEGCVKLPGYKSSKDWSSSDVNREAADYYPRGFFYPEPTTWVGYNATTKTLTFHHDGGKSTAYDDAATYTLNTGTNYPGWYENKENITKVVFDESFAQVRPTTCHLWFVNFANLTTIEGIENLNTEQVTDMRSMFYGCSSLTTLDLSTLHTTAALTDVAYMFNKCTSLTKLDISGLNTSGVTAMQSMFAECSQLKAILVQDLFSVASLEANGDSYMFGNCTSLPGYDENSTGKDKAKLYSEGGYFCNSDPVAWAAYNAQNGTLTFYYDNNKYSSSDKTYSLNSSNNQPEWYDDSSNITKVVFDESFADARPTSCYQWFANFANLTTFEGFENLNTSEVISMDRMFCNCSSLSSLDLSNMNTSKVSTMQSMFTYCTSLSELKLSEQFTGTNLQSAYSLFYGCSSLKELDLSQFKTTSALTDTRNMFYGCTSLKKLDITGMTTTNVNKMDAMFQNCSQLKAIYVSDAFTVDNVESSTKMFDGCTLLPSYNENSVDKAKACYYPNGYFASADSVAWVGYDATQKTLTFHYDNTRFVSDVDATYDLPAAQKYPGWRTHKDEATKIVFDESFAKARPTSCYEWFSLYKQLTTIEGLENLNTSEVTVMSGMFRMCVLLDTLDLSGFNTAKVTNMDGMFSGCSSLASLKFSDQFTGISLVNATYVFNNCTSLTELDLSSLKTPDNKLYTLQGMFQGCSSLTTLYLSSLNTTNVKYMNEMFSGCSALKYIYVSDNFKTSSVIMSTGMFEKCTSLPGYSSTKTDATYACYYPDGYFYNAMPKAWVGYKEAEQTLTFYYNNAQFFTEDDVTYDVSSDSEPAWAAKKDVVTKVVFDESFADARPTSCNQWFSDFKNLTTFEGFENLNTSEVTTMRAMFRNCTSLTSLDLSTFNTSNLTNINLMFDGCSALADLKFSDQFVGTNVTSASYVFDGCTALTELDLSSFKTTDKLTTTQGMFLNCTALTRLYITGLNTTNVTTMVEMFRGCSKLEAIFVSDNFKTTSVSTETNMFTGCTSLPGFDAAYIGTAKACYYPEGYFYSAMPKAWVGYKEAEQTLTFYYNNAQFISDDDATYDVSSVSSPAWAAKKDVVTKVVFDESFADARPTSCYQWFSGFKNLTTFEGFENLNTSEVITMNAMFSNCTSLTSLDLSTFNTSNLTVINLMFDGCSALANLKFSDQFVGTNVTSASYVFDGCTALTELDLSSFKTTDKLNTTQGMFRNCTALTRLYITGLNTTNVTTMVEMFRGCSKLEDIFVSDNFKTTSVSTETNMFTGCTSLPGFDPAYIGTAKACYYPEGYFYGSQESWAWAELLGGTLKIHYDAGRNASLAKQTFDVPLSENEPPTWHTVGDEVKKVVIDESFAVARPTSCFQWFQYFPFVTEIEGLEYLNTSKVTNMEDMFSGCNNLTSLDLTTWDLSSLTNASDMFENCIYLSNIYVSEDFALPTNCEGSRMFYGCTKLPNWDKTDDNIHANYNTTYGYLTLRRHFTVGDTQYNVDGYFAPTCYDDVTFTDGAAYSSACDFTFDDNKIASYTREVSNHWATLCLPFTFSADNNSTARFYSVKSYNDGTITATPITGDIEAGTPVLAYVKGNALSVTATGAAAAADAKQLTELKGTFAQTEVANDDYIIANDHFWNVSWLKSKNSDVKNVYVAPYRAYLTLANLTTGAKPNSISITEGETTSIDSIDGAASLENLLDGAEIYDLQGRRLTAPQRGVMIIRKNGVSRKVVIGSQAPQGL